MTQMYLPQAKVWSTFGVQTLNAVSPAAPTRSAGAGLAFPSAAGWVLHHEFGSSTFVDSERTASLEPLFAGRRSFLATASAAALSLALFGCSRKKTHETPSSASVNDGNLQRDVAILDEYLRRQNVVDLGKTAGVYVTEFAETNLERANLSWLSNPEQVFAMLRNKAATVQNTVPKYEPGVGGTGESVSIEITQPVVLIPQAYIRLINGTPAERNSFDSILFHEVEGHCTQMNMGSPMLDLFSTFVRHTKGDINMLQTLSTKAFEDVREAGAYLVELERLVKKFNYPSNKNVIHETDQKRIDGRLAMHVATIIVLMKNVKKGDPHSHLFEPFSVYLARIMRAVSEDTRIYVRKLLRDQDWKGPIPF